MPRLSDIYLNKYEIRFYFMVWIGAVLYSIYEVILARKALLAMFGVIIESDHLAPGWKWLGGIRDTGDDDWNVEMGFLRQMIPWAFIQLLISQILKQMKVDSMVIYSWYIIVTSTFLWNYCGFEGLKYMLFPICVMLYFKLFPDQIFMSTAIFLIGSASSLSITITDLILPIGLEDLNKYYMLHLAFDWTLLRIFSCDPGVSYNKAAGVMEFLTNIIRWTAYCWYLPTLFLGSHIAYDKFIKGVEEPAEKWTMHRIIVHVFQLMRFIFLMFFTEFILHYLYVTAMSKKPHVVMNLNAWAFYGLTYCLGQYFYHQYVVVYGITGEISRADDINAPPPPKCIGRIHLYSDMWRHFDRGLYDYLVSNVYTPSLERNIRFNKFLALLYTFVYVRYFCFRTHKLVSIAIILNFIGLIIEWIAKSIGNSTLYTRLQEKYISPRNHRRFTCILAIPLLIFSIGANLFSIHGEDYALYFFNRIIAESPFVIFILMFALYCCCQVSTEMKLIEKRKVDESESEKFLEMKSTE